MESEEASQCGIVYRKAAPDSLDEHFPYVGHGRKKVGNDGGPPEGYLAPRKNVPDKGGHYSQEKENNSDIPRFFIKIGAVVEASPDVKVDTDEEKRSAVGVHVPDESPISDVSADMRHRREGSSNV